MKKRMRLLLATATGAALLTGGLATTTAASAKAIAACELAADVSSISIGDAFVPQKDDNKVDISINVKELFGKPVEAPDLYNVEETSPAGTPDADKTFLLKKDVKSIKAEVFRTGETTVREVTLGALPADITGKGNKIENGKAHVANVPATSEIKGSFLIKEADKDKTGKWTVKVTVTRAASTESCKEFDVSGKAGLTGATVTPNPVSLVKGKDVRVSVKVSAKDASSVSAVLQSDETSESYDLGTLAKGSDGIYRGETYFADDTAAGNWTLVARAVRGGQAVEGTADFSVNAPSGGASKKAKARVTISAPAKVKAGKTFKIFGKVYRGTKAYSGKIVEVYFKKKGSSKYTFMGFARATSTGKYTKSFKGKTDGYWRVKVPGTSKTRSAMSPQEFVDIR
ncbi:hypothetical protein ACIBG8_20490 [Nonomuraea sp. NPDC050556]|uniref:hypothetical protein n=1 Tax=Nonomuraea sp. NPDC050556 TaxID=3364369 RepID=UPI0037BCCD2F